jgi:hypothetical protein
VRLLCIAAGVLTGVVALALTTGPTYADVPDTLYVNNAPTANCSDSGTGTQSRPYCTISAAVAVVAPGQTVLIANTYSYSEHVTIARSGTPDKPITVRADGSTSVSLTGTNAGITVDGQHDVTVSLLAIVPNDGAPVVDVSNANHITLDRTGSLCPSGSTSLGVRLRGVTDSTLTNEAACTLTLDAATNGVLVKAANLTQHAPHAELEVAGSHNTIVDSRLGGPVGTPAVMVDPGARDNVIADDLVFANQAVGIASEGASGTAITNDTVDVTCATAIQITGASSAVSVQNNLIEESTLAPATCPSPAGVNIGVYDDAVKDTVVDYNANSATQYGRYPYAWQTPMNLADFRAASGQAAHDGDNTSEISNIDSANSAAPGYQTRDYSGHFREDNPAIADTGTGPVSYADRGAQETVQSGSAALKLTVGTDQSSITADATGTTKPWAPATIVSYAFDFGDGTTVKQTTTVATHHYATPGTYWVTVTVTDDNGASTLMSGIRSLLPAKRSVGLLARADNRYVTISNWSLIASHPTVGTLDQFDIVSPINGRVALRSKATGLYLQTLNNGQVEADAEWASDQTWFGVINNSDGTVSLESFYGKYVSAENAGASNLVANRTAIGTWEKFNFTDLSNVSQTLKAHADNRYVTAESAGSKPLIANRTAVGQWEQFDLVDAGDGYVALLAHANNQFVTAESAGSKPLIANRSAVGAWEMFTVVHNTNGSISLRARANGRYVTAEAAGTQPLIANRTAIGVWESFN